MHKYAGWAGLRTGAWMMRVACLYCVGYNRSERQQGGLQRLSELTGERHMRISLIIPTLNAGEEIETLLECMQNQSRKPDEIVIVDSQSDDGTAERVKHYPQVCVMEIERRAFDHDGTRDMALRAASGDIVLFMTQDAIPVDENYVKNLIAPFEDERVAAVGGRQIAKADATRQEQLVRAHNYPAQSCIWDRSAIEKRGVRAFMISDCCAAYRREAYLAVGGFDHPIMTNEDMLMAQRLLEAGYSIGYRAEAAVYHSHNLTLRQQYRRNYIVGRTMKRYEARFCYVSEMGEGTKLAKAVLMQLLKEKRLGSCMAFGMDCAVRLLGNRAGRWMEGRHR